MKKILGLLIIGLALTSQAQTNGAGVWNTIEQFFRNNPTNTFDVSGYGLYNTTSGSFGEGARVGYWITPSVGAALDLSYADSAWTFASLGLAGRATFNIGTVASVSPYASAGPGWVIKSPGDPQMRSQTLVAVASAGATVDVKAIKWFQFFGEAQHVATTDPQNRILFGITKRF